MQKSAPSRHSFVRKKTRQQNKKNSSKLLEKLSFSHRRRERKKEKTSFDFEPGIQTFGDAR